MGFLVGVTTHCTLGESEWWKFWDFPYLGRIVSIFNRVTCLVFTNACWSSVNSLGVFCGFTQKPRLVSPHAVCKGQCGMLLWWIWLGDGYGKGQCGMLMWCDMANKENAMPATLPWSILTVFFPFDYKLVHLTMSLAWWVVRTIDWGQGFIKTLFFSGRICTLTTPKSLPNNSFLG